MVEEHLLNDMDKSTHEEQLSQTLQTKNTQFKIAVTFRTVFKGIFNVTNEDHKIYFAKSITDKDCFFQLPFPRFLRN